MPDYKVDFHTHSVLSHDGGIKMEEYKEILDNKILDYVAITDHNEINFALEARENLGIKIIVGEEINSSEGEIIGLYLEKEIKSGLTAEQTVEKIKQQQGLVYIPHPVNVRGVSLLNDKIIALKDQIDIIEVFNAKNIFGRFNNNPELIQSKTGIPGAVSSDAHSLAEIGRTYNIIKNRPVKTELSEILEKAEKSVSYIKPWHVFNPKINKLRKLLDG